MQNKINSFLGARLEIMEARKALAAFKAEEKKNCGQGDRPQHLGKFGEAVCFTVKELKAFLTEAEHYLTNTLGVTDEDERWIAFYHIINNSDRVPAPIKNRPSIMLVASHMKLEGENLTLIKNIISRAKDIDDSNDLTADKKITEIKALKSFDMDMYDMGNKHP